MMQVPLEEYFPGYTGGADVDKAIKFIRTQFTQVNRTGGKVQTQYASFYLDSTREHLLITEHSYVASRR